MHSGSIETRAPGRVNLIGEHTDYSGGVVLPCAIAYETRVRAASRDDRMVTVRSPLGESETFDLDALPTARRGIWSDYVRGMLIELQKAGVSLRGTDMEVTGSVPMGAGLASSAAMEIAVGLALLQIAHQDLDTADLAALARRAEAEHVGTRCGIMDQFTALHAQRGFALFLDTRSLHFELVRVPQDVEIVICNSMIKHQLAVSAYNERRRESEESAALLCQKMLAVRSLADISPPQLPEVKRLLPPELFPRVRHVVAENDRVRNAVQALRGDDLPLFGDLMYASHESLKNDYEVSCDELDLLVDLARDFEGVIGSRMTGAGFGGCTVTLVRADRAQAFRSHIVDEYRARRGIEAVLYDGAPCGGAAVVQN